MGRAAGAERRRTPTEAEIKRMIRAAQASGLHVTGIRRDGDLVEVLTGVAPQAEPVSAFDEWKARRDARSASGR